MARANFVKKARKADKANGIKVGDSYWWWKFRFGGVHKSKTRPKRSQLTQSDFLAQIYDIEDEMEEAEQIDKDMISNWVSSLESLRDECQDKLDSMPEQLQEASSSGQLLQERIDGLESWISDLENVDTDIDESDLRRQAEEEYQYALENCRPATLEDPAEEPDESEDEIYERLLQEKYDDIKDNVISANPGLG